LAAVSAWIGALAVALLPAGRGDRDLVRRLRSLRLVAAVAIVGVLATGVLQASWALRSVSQLANTAYGRVVAAKGALFLVMVGLGAVAALLAHHRRARRLVLVEAAVASAVLVLAGVLGQLPQPVDLPFASQLLAARAGLPVSVGASGPELVTGIVSPGLVGPNRIVVDVDGSDANDFPQPAAGIAAVWVQAACGCGGPARTIALTAVPGTPHWAADLDLASPATWSFTVQVAYLPGDGPAPPTAGAQLEPATLTADVEPAALPHQVVLAVPADLSGPLGEHCRDEVLGLQVALNQLNARAGDNGNLVRLVALDTHTGVAAAMERAAALHPAAVALPCGDASRVAAAVDAARHDGLPVVAGDWPGPATPGVWAVGPDPAAEGARVADQARAQGATRVTIVAGTTDADVSELAGTTRELRDSGVDFQVTGLPAEPKAWAGSLAGSDPSALVILASPAEALPLTQALSGLAEATRWVPGRGILTSSGLMDPAFINDAGWLTRVGAMEFASDVNPFDPLDQHYAVLLRQLVPGIRPTFAGVRGYEAGLQLAAALPLAGGQPTPGRLAHVLASHFGDFTVGSYRGRWTADGGGASDIAFFRSTFLNPMAMPADAPGGALSLAHEGTFLNEGGFEQVAPFRSLG
ncbi:MAG: ABC transporter substrate-binding protein, partial [Acidimicrobiia bacterium]|nr:ABC transporter substrate-binding protein [Acidimicrobiia bacterium]